jgi:hypothetical protein
MNADIGNISTDIDWYLGVIDEDNRFYLQIVQAITIRFYADIGMKS